MARLKVQTDDRKDTTSFIGRKFSEMTVAHTYLLYLQHESHEYRSETLAIPGRVSTGLFGKMSTKRLTRTRQSFDPLLCVTFLYGCSITTP
jgi:hypothetical protein